MENNKILKGGWLYYDTPVGVLCLESLFPKPKGHLRNPKTFDFPVILSIVKGVDIPRLLFNPTPELVEPFVGSCGFLARYQQHIASEVNVPVFMSSLIQIPMVRVLHGPECKIGVLTASGSALGHSHFEQVGTDINDIFIKGMEGYSEFWETIIEGKRHDFDMEKLEKEICHAADEICAGNELDALVLECTDLSAFSHAIQKAIERPVYDINSLVEWAHYSVCRRVY